MWGTRTCFLFWFPKPCSGTHYFTLNDLHSRVGSPLKNHIFDISTVTEIIILHFLIWLLNPCVPRSPSPCLTFIHGPNTPERQVLCSLPLHKHQGRCGRGEGEEWPHHGETTPHGRRRDGAPWGGGRSRAPSHTGGGRREGCRERQRGWPCERPGGRQWSFWPAV